jgi:hypothetical protein
MSAFLLFILSTIETPSEARGLFFTFSPFVCVCVGGGGIGLGDSLSLS